MKSLKIDHTNMMVKVTETVTEVVGGNKDTNSWIAKTPIVFKKVEVKMPTISVDPIQIEQKPTVDPIKIQPMPVKIWKPIAAPEQDFTKVLDKKMCNNYNQLSIKSSSVETCSELVKAKKECRSGHGHFFYGEVNPNHKECACCVAMGEKVEDEKTRASVHFNLYKMKHDKVTVDTKPKDENDEDDLDDNF